MTLFAVCLVLLVCITSAQPDYQINGLYALYNSTDGANWNWKDNSAAGLKWNFEGRSKPCSVNANLTWQGILCTVPDDGNITLSNITAIELTAYGLKGELPSEIQLVSTLNTLKLKGNKLNGTIPSEVANMSNLEKLQLQGNKLVLPLPFLGNHIHHLNLADNAFSGKFPEILGESFQLTEIQMYRNNFAGPFPAIFENLSSLSNLQLGQCNFTGTLPSYLGLLPLSKLDIVDNNLTGSIPSSFGLLTDMKVLFLSLNEFTGTFPSVVFNMSDIEYLDLGNNDFYGTIPNNIGSLSSMVQFVMDLNRFSGTIPSSLCTVTQLALLSLSGNQFNGTLPSDIGNFSSNMFMLSVGENRLTGTVPNSVLNGISDKLRILALSGNRFEGTIPSVEGVSNHSLSLFDLSRNHLTGTIPASISKLVHLTGLQLRDNSFTGTIPNVLCMMRLRVVIFDVNMITGTVPTCVGQLHSLNVFSVMENSLEGTIPTGFGNTLGLSTLVLRDNFLTGNLANNVNMPTGLETLDVSTNQLTGPLPLYLFSYKKLSSFVATGNCMTGSIDSSICNAPSLRSLVLTGLHASPSCSEVFALGLYTYRSLDGSIPPCLFAMTSLRSLYLSANGLSGTLPDFAANHVLQNISVSFNRLSGTIPVSWQTHSNQMRSVDFSFNRFSGTLDSVLFNSNRTMRFGEMQVNYNNNWLSGEVPSVTSDMMEMDMMTVNILAGNMFDCPLFTANVLPGDPNSKKYACGSNDLDLGVMSYGIIVGVAMVFIWLTVRLVSRHIGRTPSQSESRPFPLVLTWLSYYLMWTPLSKSGNHHMYRLAEYLYQFRRYAIATCAVSLFMFFPLYLLLKSINNGEYRQYTHQYGWVVSLGFLNGELPGIVIGLCWSGFLIVLLLWTSSSPFRVTPASSSETSDGVKPESEKSMFSSNIFYLLFTLRWEVLSFISNLIIVCFVNGSYVSALLYSPVAVKLTVAALVVLFKLLWNPLVCVPVSNRLGLNAVMTLVVLVTNNIVIPVFASMAVDDSCFQQIFVHPEPIATTYAYDTCDLYIGDVCHLSTPRFVEVNIKPPYVYGYECFSAVLNNYVPIYIAMYACLGLIIPAGRVAVLLYFEGYRNRNEGDNGMDLKKMEWLSYCKKNLFWLHGVSLSVVSRMVLPIESIEDMVESELGDALPRAHVVARPVSFNRRSSKGLGVYTSVNSLYGIRTICFDLMVAFVVMLTFGLAYPPLAVMVCIFIVTSSLVLQVSVHSHFIQLVQLSTLLPGVSGVWEEIMSLEFVDVPEILFSSLNAAFVCSALFVGAFIVDMTHHAVSIFPVAVAVVCAMMLRYAYNKKCSQQSSDGGKAVVEGNSLELQTLGGDSESSKIEIVENPIQSKSVSE